MTELVVLTMIIEQAVVFQIPFLLTFYLRMQLLATTVLSYYTHDFTSSLCFLGCLIDIIDRVIFIIVTTAVISCHVTSCHVMSSGRDVHRLLVAARA